MICPLTEAENDSRACETDGATFEEIAAALGMTTEGARQALKATVRKLWRQRP